MDCMAINNCDDCIKRLLVAGGNEDSAREACSQEGKLIESLVVSHIETSS